MARLGATPGGRVGRSAGGGRAGRRVAYCSFGLPEGGISEIELYGLQSWYTASLCHHNGAAKKEF